MKCMILGQDNNYLWELNPNFDIFKINHLGNFQQQLTNQNGYDAEGAISPNGRWIVYTSLQTGFFSLFLILP